MTIRLIDVSRRLAAQYGRPAPEGGYGRLWRAIVGGRLPAEKRGPFWLIREQDLPLAAAILDMVAETPPAAKARPIMPAEAAPAAAASSRPARRRARAAGAAAVS